MPFQPEQSLLRVEVPALHTIDTTSVENLFGMWSLFSKTSHAMQDGKRLENLSWRLWNREAFCCGPKARSRSSKPSSSSASRRAFSHASDDAVPPNMHMPALSSSLDSAPDDHDHDDDDDDDDVDLDTARPELRRYESNESRHGGCARHITPTHLEKMVITITEAKQLEPIELPTRRARQDSSASTMLTSLTLDAKPSPTPHMSSSHATLLESSASTLATHDSHASNTSSGVTASDESSNTEMSTHSIVRGFIPGGAPSSYRSQTHLAAAQPTPILKKSPQYQQVVGKKKGATFTIGSSSGEEESSLESHMYRSSLSESVKRPTSMTSGTAKQTSFKDEVAVGRAADRHSAVFESDDEDEDEEVSESAIEDDDDSSDWEDSDDQSGPSSVNEKELFQRVDSRPQLSSRRSLLTSLMHEPDRAKALSNAASRSTPAIRRSRNSTPNGPSMATSPEPVPPFPEHARARPIAMTTSSGSQPQQIALSPRTTRRNMLSTELTESLRKNLLWERQHRSTGNLAALKRRHTANDVKTLRQHPEPGPVLSHQNGHNHFTNDYFHAGLGEYHTKGW